MVAPFLVKGIGPANVAGKISHNRKVPVLLPEPLLCHSVVIKYLYNKTYSQNSKCHYCVDNHDCVTQ